MLIRLYTWLPFPADPAATFGTGGNGKGVVLNPDPQVPPGMAGPMNTIVGWPKTG